VLCKEFMFWHFLSSLDQQSWKVGWPLGFSELREKYRLVAAWTLKMNFWG
jgi:hypothetical protein